jgi:putative tricarboxylic transport membrane protein
MRFNDFIAGLVMVSLALLVFFFTRNYPLLIGQKYGPALFPNLLAGGLIAFSVPLFMRGLKQKQFILWQDWASKSESVVNLFLLLAAMLFFIFALDYFGFVITGFITLFVLLKRYGVTLKASLFTALFTTLAIQFFFGRLMRVPLPRGLLDFNFWGLL